MEYLYGEFDGSDFPTQDKLFGFDQVMQFILQYGEQALKALQQLMNDPKSQEQSDLLKQLLEDGMLDKDSNGKLKLTPRSINRMQRKALMEVFSHLKRGGREGHEKTTAGSGSERLDGTRPYQYGDPVSEIDLHQTLHNALSRNGIANARKNADGKISVDFKERDFELHLHEGITNCSTVVLLDMSGSMMRYDRFSAAKQVALAMQALVRTKFPQDTIDFVGFYSGAAKISESQLPLAMPKQVTVFDYQVKMRVKLDQIDQAPQHFTNLHIGLQLARRILHKRASENRQIFIITDGQPTAHVEGDYVHLLYPPDQKSTLATLNEAVLAVRDGCRFSTFALIEDYWGMDWVDFVDQLTRLTKGVAFYTNSGDLASCIMESYLSGRRKKTHIV